MVELLVVIAIIGILAVQALFKSIEKGKVSDLDIDISTIRSAVLSYYSGNSDYPA